MPNKATCPSKRFRITVFFLALNFLTFWVGMWKGLDLMTVGSGLAAMNLPLYGYLFAESYRPSNENGNKNEDIKHCPTCST